MIALWGPRADGPLAEVLAALECRGERVCVIDQLDAARAELDVCVDARVSGTLRLPGETGETVELDAVRAVYVRPYDTRRIPEVAAAGAGSALWTRALQFDAALGAWLEVAPARVVNRLSAMASNDSKPYQAQRIRAHFDVPATLVTTDRDAALRLRARHGAVIYKSTSGVRSTVARLADGELADARLADLASCPVQLQEYVAGVDVRVHVVGAAVFAAEVRSAADDYRADPDVRVRALELPADVAARCRALAAALDLAVAGIDLRRRDDGRWVCFEVNPSPGFTFYTARTGQPVADHVAALLAVAT